jgi:hypothetical protein
VAHYQQVVEQLLEQELGIAQYFSYIVIKSPILRPHPPLARLFPPRD